MIVAGFALGAIVALVGTSDLHWLILPILLFFGCGVVTLIAVVLRLAQKDPTPLVLGEMTGEDWIAHRRLIMGDSQRGDRVELPPASGEAPSLAEADEVTREQPRTLSSGEEQS